ncbi:MAG: glycolate oxidase subunit GlcF, partial [Gammaproteobacteria bacterium]
PQARHPRRMIVLEGCAQPAATPRTNAAAARVLDRLGISLISSANAGCCGAANQHLSDHDGARQMIRANIDAWWPEIEQGAERIVVTASGCGVQVKDYGRLMASDPSYSDKAQRISELTADLGELFSELDLDVLGKPGEGRRIAYHAPCTLQHGQKLPGLLEGILGRLGFELVPVADPHLCCGSAGTYSLLQTGISKQLLGNKLRNLQSNHPELIATANVGCQLHLATGSEVPVVHWIELLDQETA